MENNFKPEIDQSEQNLTKHEVAELYDQALFPTDLLDELKVGVIFPGQGSQFLGMGKEFYDSSRLVQEMFETANMCLKENFVQLCFASSEECLKGTIETQAGIFLVSASIYSLLQQKYNLVPEIIAGHSLGEYTAVFAAGGMSFIDSLYLLKKRAQIVKENALRQDGAMLAVLGLDFPTVERICKTYDQVGATDAVAELAIENSTTQFVISGTRPELVSISHDVALVRGKAVFLPIAGAYHSRLMIQAEREFAQYLVKADFKPLEVPIVNNVEAKIIYSEKDIKHSIVRQTAGHIQWWKSMSHFSTMDLIIEIGPNDKFSKILRREWPSKPIISINKPEDIPKLAQLIIDVHAALAK